MTRDKRITKVVFALTVVLSIPTTRVLNQLEMEILSRLG